MLSLTLLRHAKSSWDDPALSDHARPLNKRGTKAACRIGRYIAENKFRPDLILCSDAVRTRATLALIRPAFAHPAPKTIVSADLYLAPPAQIINIVATEARDARHVMVIGHNPGLHDLALSLSKTANRADIAQLSTKYPTAALAHFTLDVSDWSDFPKATGNLEYFIIPRTLSE